MSILKDTHVEVYYRCRGSAKLQEEHDVIVPLWVALIMIVLGLLPIANIFLFAAFIIYYAIHAESVVAYLDYVQYRYKPPNDYYEFLSEIGYAEDPNYINKLKGIVSRNDKRRSE